MLRDLDHVEYLPMLGVRPAEMVALESLPERDKDLMLPVFRLRPWVSANRLGNALDRLSEAYGGRPCYVMLGEPEAVLTRREVHDEIDVLRSSLNGFDAWCSFFEAGEHNNLIPVLQLTDVNEFDAQATRLHALGRGTSVVVERVAFQFLRQIVTRTAAATEGGRGVLFVLDFGRQGRDFLLQQAECTGYIRTVLDLAPESYVAVSASSFPESFTLISDQEIFERRLFETMRPGFGRKLIYSDRGSARAERQSGGGGAPAPRIDYAQRTQWTFFRSEEDVGRPQAYQEQAQALMRSSRWDPALRLWGTQMIERTAAGDETAIVSPARSTAARINIHLHQQLFYRNPDAGYDTDEEWTD